MQTSNVNNKSGEKAMPNRYFVTLLINLVMAPVLAFAGYASGGAFVGYYSPAIQPEAESGIAWGVKARMKIIMTLYVEPYFYQIQENDREITIGNAWVTREGNRITSLGVNLLVGNWLDESARPYALVGAGIYKVEISNGEESSNRFGSNWGAGVEFAIMPKRLFLDINAQLQLIEWDNRTYMKSIIISSGLNWYFKIGR
jgi:opacity protein-like surface antigen